MSSIFNNVSNYLPYTTIRGINKQLYSENQQYCKIASHIYMDDMKLIHNQNNSIVYYEYDQVFYAVVIKNDYHIIYKVKQVDQYIVLTIHKKLSEPLDDNSIVDIDIINKFKIFKSRGCEDMIENYSKTNTSNELLKTFTNYFKPEVMIDMLYLYVYLHSNCVLLDNEIINDETKKFNLNKLPKKSFLQKIYDMYNVLYVRVNLL